MNHYVYLLRSADRFYVGLRSCRGLISTDTYRGSGHALKDARKAGLRFSKTVLCVLDSREEAALMEAELVGPAEVADRQCLNLQQGGIANSVGYRHTDKARASMSNTRKGRKMSAAHRQAMSDCRVGKKRDYLTSETRARMSANSKKLRHTDEAKAKIGKAALGNTHSLGHKHTQEFKDNVSRVHKGKKVSDETRRKMSVSSRGVPGSTAQRAANDANPRTHTEETKEKMSRSKTGVPWSALRRARFEARKNS